MSRTRDLAKLGTEFAPAVAQDPVFSKHGFLSGTSGNLAWVAVDPLQHPLEVWERRRGGRTYAGLGRQLGTVVATNGPYMGRFSPSTVGVIIGAAATGGAVAGRRILREPVLGGVAGATVGGLAALSGWAPCGRVTGARRRIEATQVYRAEGPTHAWLGRFGYDFSSYSVGMGDVPAGLLEGMGGLAPLVVDGRPCARNPTDERYHEDFARMTTKGGLVAWALIPLPAPGRGIVAVFGSRGHAYSAEIGELLANLGASGAVRTDSSGCAMLVVRQRFLVGPPAPHRQRIQRYGLMCAASC
jgi:hypothetical protein